MFQLLKNLLVLSIVVGALMIVGFALNSLIPWQYLDYLFIIIRHFAFLFDFFWDTTTLFVLVGISFLIEVSIWGYRAVSALLHGSGLNK